MTTRERGRSLLAYQVTGQSRTILWKSVVRLCLVICTILRGSVMQIWRRHNASAVRWAASGILPTAIVSGVVATSYHPVAHGGQRAFLASIILTALATLVAAAVVTWLSGSMTWTLIATGVILVAGHALHVVRLAQAPTVGVPIAYAREEFLNAEIAQRWQFTAEDGSEVSLRDGRLVIRTSPGVRAFVTMPLPPRPAALLLPRPRWWHLMGLGRPSVTEELRWTARLKLQNQFFVIAMIDRLLLQGTPYGMHLTVPQADGSVVGHEVHQAPVADGVDHTWRFARSGDWVALEIDERQVWRGLALGPLREIRLGEVHTDELHGGKLSIEHVEYRLAWDG